MKKLIVPFVASFGLSLGIATGVVIARTPKAPLHPVVKVAAVAPTLDSSIPGKVVRLVMTETATRSWSASDQDSSGSVALP